METTQEPTQINGKEATMLMYNGILFSLKKKKKKKKLSLVTVPLKLEETMLGKINETQKGIML